MDIDTFTVVAAVLAGGLFVYLAAALWWPEDFS